MQILTSKNNYQILQKNNGPLKTDPIGHFKPNVTTLK